MMTFSDISKTEGKLKLLTAAFFVLPLAACDSSSGGGGADALGSRNMYVAQNGSGNSTIVTRLNNSFAVDGTFTTGGNEGITFDNNGNFYQAADNEMPGKIRVVASFEDQFDNGSASSDSLRNIGGAGTASSTLVAPKGLIIIDNEAIVVADFGADSIKTFNASDNGDVPPIAIAPVSAAKPWDISYDRGSDTLFSALTNGNVDIYDNFTENGYGVAGPNRTITPVNDSGAKVSVNLHGIHYSAENGRLYLSDVGAATADQSANFASDGALFIIENAINLSGNVQIQHSISGPSTRLGNPVDLIVEDGVVFIAEKAGDAILGFDNFPGESGDVPPSIVIGNTKPEALAIH